MTEVTLILSAAERGDPGAGARLLPLVYEELRQLAAARMAGERRDHTLGATALVHEAWIRLAGPGGPGHWEGRAHFFHAAAEAMRRILIDHARARATQKRGGGGRGGGEGKGKGAGGGRISRIPPDVLELAAHADSEEILALDEAVSRLEAQSAEAAEVVRLRFYAGLSVDDTAAALGTSARSVNRLWAFARAWLFRELEAD